VKELRAKRKKTSKYSEHEHVLKLQKDLQTLHELLRDEMKTKWQRVLPFDELLFDRWEKSKYLGARKDTSVYHNSYIYGDVRIGKGTWVGPYTLLDGSGGTLKIGDYCSISSGVQIYTHHTVKWALSGGKAEYEKAPTTIGNCCYLGPYSIVTMGITVGHHSLVGSMSLVNKDAPPNSIVFGIPGRVVGHVKVRGSKIEFVYEK